MIEQEALKEAKQNAAPLKLDSMPSEAALFSELCRPEEADDVISGVAVD